MYGDRASYWNRERVIAAVGAVAVQALVGWALVNGLAVRFPRVIDEGLKLFAPDMPPPPSTVRVEPPRERTKRAEGRAAPPNLHSRATQVAAPPPVIVVPPPPPPVIAAPRPADASDAMSGATDRRGPGTGAGGEGDGFGSGGDGDGTGGGWRDETSPRFLKGRMSTGDLPDDLLEFGFSGTVGVRYTVGIDGRVPECRVTRSSGDPRVDALTCRMIRERFRFRPSRDGRGQPVAATIVENHSWDVEQDPPSRR